eukprot:EG_transcript_23347
MAHVGKVVNVEGSRGFIKPTVPINVDGLKLKTVAFTPTQFCRNVGDEVSFDLKKVGGRYVASSLILRDDTPELSLEDLLHPVPFELPDTPCYSWYHRVFIGKIFGKTELEKQVTVHLLRSLADIIRSELTRSGDQGSSLVCPSHPGFPGFILKLFEHLERTAKPPEVMAAAVELRRLVHPHLTFKQVEKIPGWDSY